MRVAVLLFGLLAAFQAPSASAIEILKSIDYHVSLGDPIIVALPQVESETGLTCILETPQGEQIQFRPDEENINEDFVLEEVLPTSFCSVSITNVKKEYLGDWKLIADVNGWSSTYRKVLPFSVIDTDASSEEQVNNEPSEIIREDVVEFPQSLDTVTVTTKHEFGDAVFGCFLQTPQKDLIIFRPTSESTNNNEDFVLQPTLLLSDCSVTIRNMKKLEYLGDWELIAYIRDASHNEHRRILPFTVYEDASSSVEVITESESESSSESELEPEPEIITPEPTREPEPEVTTLAPELEVAVTTHDPLKFVTSLQNTLQIRIPRILVNTFHSCHLRTPEGIDLTVDSDLDFPGLQVQERELMSNCLIHLTVSEEMNGEWMLFTKESNNKDEPQEIRQPFEVDIEESINTFPREGVTIERGRDLYLRLDQAVADLVSCDLKPPPDLEDAVFTRDVRYADSCGFIVQNVKPSDTGTWQIVAKAPIRYIGKLHLTVEETVEAPFEKILLTQGEPVQKELGPSNALFCQMRDPDGSVVYSGFSACRLELASVGLQHMGSWSTLVGLPGRLTAVERTFDVEVEESVVLNRVTQKIERGSNSLSLSCSMLTDRPSTICKFIRPDSAVFLVHEGVGEGRYSYFGSGVRELESGHHQVDCGLHIDAPLGLDFGTWRCVLEHEDQTSNSFFRVSAASNAVDDITEGFVEEPKTTTPRVSVVVDDAAVLSCSVAALVNYCWFRHHNGTVISVAPGVDTPSYAYYGSGFDSGECGIMIYHAQLQDAGSWTCNVGIGSRNDLSVGINVAVHSSPMVVAHRFYHSGKNSLAMVLEGRTYNNSALDYCRFVTPTGLGFNSDTTGLPASRYSFFGTDTSAGFCRLTVDNVGWAEHGVWTVAGRVEGGAEIEGTTHPQHMLGQSGGFFVSYFLLIFLLVILNIVFIYVLVHKKSRRWTSTRASAIGNSIRNSFRKTRSPNSNNNSNSNNSSINASTSNDTSALNSIAASNTTAVEDAPPGYETAIAGNQNSGRQNQTSIEIEIPNVVASTSTAK